MDTTRSTWESIVQFLWGPVLLWEAFLVRQQWLQVGSQLLQLTRRKTEGGLWGWDFRDPRLGGPGQVHRQNGAGQTHRRGRAVTGWETLDGER